MNNLKIVGENQFNKGILNDEPQVADHTHGADEKELHAQESVRENAYDSHLTSLLSTIDKEEWVELLSKEGGTIGEMTRGVMRAHGMLHKATYLIVHNFKNQILVQKRTLTKDYCPGFFDAAAGGVVQKEEDILQSIKREAEEELGIFDIPFVSHGTFHIHSLGQNILGYLFSCISAGPFALQASEIEEVKWMSIEEIFDHASDFTPDSLVALQKWINRE